MRRFAHALGALVLMTVLLVGQIAAIADLGIYVRDQCLRRGAHWALCYALGFGAGFGWSTYAIAAAMILGTTPMGAAFLFGFALGKFL